MRLSVCICARILVNMPISSATCSSLRPLPRAMRRLWLSSDQAAWSAQAGNQALAGQCSRERMVRTPHSYKPQSNAGGHRFEPANQCRQHTAACWSNKQQRLATQQNKHRFEGSAHLREGLLASSSGCSRSFFVIDCIIDSYCKGWLE